MSCLVWVVSQGILQIEKRTNHVDFNVKSVIKELAENVPSVVRVIGLEHSKQGQNTPFLH